MSVDHGHFYERVEEIFAQVSELPPDARTEALDRLCHGDLDLRAEVESLLTSDGGGVTFIRDLVSGEAQAFEGTVERNWIGRRVGAWKITGVLGRGGMGAVYEVRRDDGAFRQRAALKIIRADVDSGVGRRRFVEERQILAHLNHPNIARLLDGGESDDGVPFLVMEAVDGQPITDYCDAAGLSIAQRLRLFVTVCRAVHFAHTQLIVHRDLKPTNIMVASDGTVKLLDFGIAKLIEPGAERAATIVGEVALTPDYASPEQVRSEPVTTSTDIYSLGAVLYELLTGGKAHAFSSYSLPEFARVICEVQPGTPSDAVSPRLARQLRGDVDNIVLTALRKDPTRRYSSAEQLAEDLDRHLTGRPVAARADSWSYRTGKFILRNRLGVAAVSLLIVSLIGGMLGMLWQARRAERRFAEVRQLANTFLFTFHDEIRDLPGSTPARELIVRTALQYLDNLSAEAKRDASLQMELGAAYEKVGDVLGNPSNPNLGRTEDALKSYQKSLALRLAASGRTVDSPAEGRAVLYSHLKMADILIGAGRTEESERHTRSGVELAGKFGTDADRLQAMSRVGELALRGGDLASAEDVYRDAMAIANAEAKRSPGLASDAMVAQSASKLGYVYKMASRQQECLQTLAIALEASQKLSAAEPTRTTHIRQIMKIHNDRGDALRSPFAAEGMRPDLSLIEYTASLQRAEWLAKADPSDVSARMGLLLARAQIADTWREIDAKKALPLFHEFFPMTEELKNEDPSNFQLEWLSSVMGYAHADTYRRAGDLQGALLLFDRAVERIGKMRETDRGRKISSRDIMKAHAERGEVRLMLGDLEGAAADARDCLPFTEAFVTAKARPLDLRDTAYCHALAGDVAMRKGDAAGAVRRYDAALVQWNEFGRRKLDSPFLRGHAESAQRRRDEASRKVAR